MDFMANVLIKRYYIVSLFSIIASIYLCILIYRFVMKGQNIVTKKYISDEFKEGMQKSIHIYNYGFLMVIVFFISASLFLFISSIMVLPAILNEDYETIVCTVESSDPSERQVTYTTCKNESQFISFQHSSEILKKGTTIQVNYYKYIGIGTIIDNHYQMEE